MVRTENGLRVGDGPEVQEICAEKAGIAEVPFTGEGSPAGKPAGKLLHLSRDGVELVARKGRFPLRASAASRGARSPDGEQRVV